MRWSLLVVAVACDGDDLTCGEGTARVGDVCEAEAEDSDLPTVDDLLEQVPACEPREADGRIDLVNRCVDGGCAGMTVSELEAIWGEADCQSFGGEFFLCDWSFGVSEFLVDDDGDGEVGDQEVFSIDLDERFDGTTEDGAGLGMGFGCWLDQLEGPASIRFQWVKDAYVLTSVGWEGVYVDDGYGGGKDGYDPDGLVESLSMYERFSVDP